MKKMKKYNVAVVGATGMVGRKFLQVLTERQLPVEFIRVGKVRGDGNRLYGKAA